MASSFVTYIDESGCDGFCFSRGASEWLVLAGSVFRKPRELADVAVVDTVRAQLATTLIALLLGFGVWLVR